MNDVSNQFNTTIEELLTELGDIFDSLHRAGEIEEDGSFMEVISIILQGYGAGSTLIESFCESHDIWRDCYKREVEFLLKDFSSLFDFEFDFNKLQTPAKIFLANKKGSGITQEDVDIIFDYLVALSRHACTYVSTMRQTNPDYMSEFPLEELKNNFNL